MVAHYGERQAVKDDPGELRVTVTELPDLGYDHGAEAARQRAFERGYRVAVTEVIGSLLPATEAFLREQGPVSAEVGEAFYRFERFLARRFDATIRADAWVEGGGGI
jgi:hypothetical protein